MKKNLLSAVLLIAGCSGAFSQSVPNGNFEGWTSYSYMVPQFYTAQTPNPQALQSIGQIVTSRVADPFHGTYAIKLETKTDGKDTVSGFFVNGQPGSANPPGGMPYSQQPTGITGHYKCGVPPGDSAIMVLIFKKNGTMLPNGFLIKKFTGTQSSYAAFNYTFSLSMAPDTVILGAAASNIAMGNFKGIPGSFLQLDSLNFTGVVSQPANMNGSFELWNTNNLDLPNGWKVQGDSVKRSTSAYANNYAVALQVVNYGNYVEPDQITTGHFTNMSGPKGGYPYTLQMDSLVGYYKFNSIGGDTAVLYLQGTKLGSQVGGYNYNFLSSSVYKRFSVPINFSSAADTLRVDIVASKWPVNSAWAGSKLWVDNLQLLSQPLSVQTLFMGEQYLGAFPNPSKGVFKLVYDSESADPVNLTVFNEIGQAVHTQVLQGGGFKNQIDLSAFQKGLYLLKTEQNGKVSSRRIIIE